MEQVETIDPWYFSKEKLSTRKWCDQDQPKMRPTMHPRKYEPEEFSNDVIMLKWHLSFGIEMDIFEKNLVILGINPNAGVVSVFYPKLYLFIYFLSAKKKKINFIQKKIKNSN